MKEATRIWLLARAQEDARKAKENYKEADNGLRRAMTMYYQIYEVGISFDVDKRVKARARMRLLNQVIEELTAG